MLFKILRVSIADSSYERGGLGAEKKRRSTIGEVFIDPFNNPRFQMEYGIWSFHAAGELWGDPRLARRHPILPPSATQLLPRAAFALSGLHRPDMVPLPLTSAGPPYGPMELVTKRDGEQDAERTEEKEEEKQDDNEGNIERADENDNQVRFAIIFKVSFMRVMKSFAEYNNI